MNVKKRNPRFSHKGSRKKATESNRPEGEGAVRNLVVEVERDLFRESRCVCHFSYKMCYILFPFLHILPFLIQFPI